MTNAVEVYFALKGDDFDPDAFTKRSGIKPTRVFRKGELRRNDKKYEFGMWALSLGQIESDVLLVGEFAEQLIVRLERSVDHIACAMSDEELYAVLQIVLHVSVNDNVPTPSVGFSSRTIAFLHKVGATISVDIYRSDNVRDG
jgi:hypothetical protein